MKRSILNLGKTLSKTVQKEILGGRFKTQRCNSNSDCCNFQHNSSYGYVCHSRDHICVPGIFLDPENHPCGL